MRISIVIITRNRALLLDRCLNAITKQVLCPMEVIIVNNGSTDNSKDVIAQYRNLLPIISIFEHRVGIPFARNDAIAVARGDILAFLDDDCAATTEWLKLIHEFFIEQPSSVGIIGKSLPDDSTSIPQLVEYAYNQRWINMNTHQSKGVGRIESGVAVDFKNAAFKRQFIKKFLFSLDIPYGDVGNEDTDVGQRLFAANSEIYYSQRIVAYHVYSSTFFRLFQRNFWVGYGDALFERQKNLTLRAGMSFNDWLDWFIRSQTLARKLSLYSSFIYCVTLLCFPIFSRLGRLSATASVALGVSIPIPSR